MEVLSRCGYPQGLKLIDFFGSFLARLNVPFTKRLLDRVFQQPVKSCPFTKQIYEYTRQQIRCISIYEEERRIEQARKKAKDISIEFR